MTNQPRGAGMPVKRKKLSTAKKAAAKKAGAKGKTSTGIDSSVVKTHVPKGANRASASTRRTKHAQRTPLPPKGKIKPGTARKNTERLKELAAASARATAMEKAQDLVAYAESHDWWAEIKEERKDGIVRVSLKRIIDGRKEEITAEWSGDRVAKGGILLTFPDNGRVVVLRNVSAAKKHIDGSKTIKHEVAERRPRRQRGRHLRQITVREDGTVEVDDEEDDVTPRYAPVGAHIIDKWYDMVVTKTKKGKGKSVTKVVARIEGIGTAQMESLRRIWEADGLTVTVKDRSKSA